MSSFRPLVAGHGIVPEIAALARQYRQGVAGIPDERTARVPSPGTGPFVVAVAYRIPEHRVQDFCAWNDAAFRALRARVYLVVEKPYPGLTAALAEMPACGVAVATDIDVVLSTAAFEFMALTPAGAARAPLYLMADSYPERATRRVPAPLATGTVAMAAAGWGKVRYDERCEGYGSEDTIVLLDIAAAGMTVDRMPGMSVHHIAHQAGTPQREFHGRTDHWGRAEGFNPENFRANNQFWRERQTGKPAADRRTAA